MNGDQSVDSIQQEVHSNIQTNASSAHYAPAAPEGQNRLKHTHPARQRSLSPASNSTTAVGGHEPLTDPFNSNGVKPMSSCPTGLVYDGVRNMRLNPVAIPDLKLMWSKPPTNVLLVKKNDPDNIHRVQGMVDWLVQQRQLTVYVEASDVDELKGVHEFDVQKHRKLIDFCITIGGDGTVLQLSALFTGPWNVPPVMSFMGGTLGFLTSFDFDDYERLIDRVLNSTAKNDTPCDVVTVCPRMRLLCTVYRQLEKGSKPVAYKSFQPLNEMLLGRGSSPFLTIVDIFLARPNDDHTDDELIGTVLADGLLVSSATGSTAYSMAAGGPMVSPSAPAMLVTPVCPHSLSFRPIILPDVSRLSLRVSCRSRSSAVAAFDGRGQVELAPGDYVHVQMSPWPVPSINISNKSAESLWFRAITQKLHWNIQSGNSQPPPLGSTSNLDSGCKACKADADDKQSKHKSGKKDKQHNNNNSNSDTNNTEHIPRPPSSIGSPSRRLVSHTNDPDDNEFSLHGDAVSHHNSDDEHDDEQRQTSGTSARSDIQVSSGERVNLIQRNNSSARHLSNGKERSRNNKAGECEVNGNNCAGHIERLASDENIDNSDEEVVTGKPILMRDRTEVDPPSQEQSVASTPTNAQPRMSNRQHSSGSNSKL